MILQALNDYYRRKCDDPDPAQHLPSFGLEQKEIPFVLEIDAQGELVQLLDTRTLNGKKKIAQSFRVPQGVKKTSGVAANLLYSGTRWNTCWGLIPKASPSVCWSSMPLSCSGLTHCSLLRRQMRAFKR
jgi:hypothetical protein